MEEKQDDWRRHLGREAPSVRGRTLPTGECVICLDFTTSPVRLWHQPPSQQDCGVVLCPPCAEHWLAGDSTQWFATGGVRNSLGTPGARGAAGGLSFFAFIGEQHFLRQSSPIHKLSWGKVIYFII